MSDSSTKQMNILIDRMGERYEKAKPNFAFKNFKEICSIFFPVWIQVPWYKSDGISPSEWAEHEKHEDFLQRAMIEVPEKYRKCHHCGSVLGRSEEEYRDHKRNQRISSLSRGNDTFFTETIKDKRMLIVLIDPLLWKVVTFFDNNGFQALRCESSDFSLNRSARAEIVQIDGGAVLRIIEKSLSRSGSFSGVSPVDLSNTIQRVLDFQTQD